MIELITIRFIQTNSVEFSTNNFEAIYRNFTIKTYSLSVREIINFEVAEAQRQTQSLF